jgi:20S proteasome subunit beta 7
MLMGCHRSRFLASADLLGTTFSAPALASGFGAHLAIPLLRRAVPDEAAVAGITRERAIEVVEECMKVLFYRDARSMNKYSMAIIGGEGERVDIEWRKNVELKQQSWKFAEGIRGYGAQVV